MDLLNSGLDFSDFQNPQSPTTPLTQIGDLDFSSFSTSSTKTTKKAGPETSFQPANSDWNISKVQQLKDWYKSSYGNDMPISNFGQGSIHNSWGLDHRNSIDIPYEVGKKLEPYLRENNIPFLAYDKAVKGQATGKHFHIGFPSKGTSNKYPINAIIDQYQIPQTSSSDLGLDFSSFSQEDNQLNQEIDNSNLHESDHSNDSSTLDFGVFSNLSSGVKGETLSEIPDIPTISTQTIEFTGTPEEIAKKKLAYKEYNKQQILKSQNGTSLGDMITNGITKQFSVPLEIKPDESEDQIVQNGYFNAARARGIPEHDAMMFAVERLSNAKAKGRSGVYKGFSNDKLTPDELEQSKTQGYTTFNISDPEDIKALNDKAASSRLDFMGQTLSTEQTRAIENIVKDANNASASYRGATEGEAAGIGGLFNLFGGFTKAAIAGDFSPAALATNYLGTKITGINQADTLSYLASNDLYKQADVMTNAANILRLAHPSEERQVGKSTNSWAPFARDITGAAITGIKLIATSPLGPAQLPLLGYFESRRDGIVPSLKSAGIGAVMQVALGGLGKLFTPAEGVNQLLSNVPETLSPAVKSIISHTGQAGAFTVAMTGQGMIQGESLEQSFIENAPFGILPIIHGLDEFGNKKTEKNLIGNLAQTIDDNGDLKYGGLVTEDKGNGKYEIKFQEINKHDPLIQKWMVTENKIAKLSNTEFEAIKTIEKVANISKAEVKEVKNAKDSPETIFSTIGKDNYFTSQQGATDIVKNFFKLRGSDGTLKATLIPYGDIIAKKGGDLAYLGAFFLEDFYHRGIKPTVSELANRLKVTLGDAISNFSQSDFLTIFNNANDIVNSNIADPFFSKMKQDALEKLPNKFDVGQARNVLGVHKNESEWTVGLEDFLKENEGKKISKNDLIDVIQRGQLRVEESVADETEPQRVHQQLRIISDKLLSLENDNSLDAGMRKSKLKRDRLALEDKLTEIENTGRPQYSLKAYPSMNLELPGAENSKEVKLISAINPQEPTTTIEDYAQRIYHHDSNWVREKGFGELLDRNYKEFIETKKLEYQQDTTKFPGQHGFPDNTVAHYRSNDRTTTDNIPVHHGEEFQSDWNQEIQDKGLKNKLSFEEIKKLNLEYDNLVTEKSGLQYQRSGDRRQAEINTRLAEINVLLQHNDVGLEPNPFMGNLWKELVLKRFLRDSVIAKDENGNYKYEGITWTTARQQQERYNQLLASTELRVHRVSIDAEYYQVFKQSGEYVTDATNLDRAKQLAKDEQGYYTKREGNQYEIEAKNPQTGTFVKIPNAPIRGTLEEWEPIVGKEYIEKISQTNFNGALIRRTFEEQKRYLELISKENQVGTANLTIEEQLELSELDDDGVKADSNNNLIIPQRISGSELTFGDEGFADYDVAYKNILSKIGKRFGASYGEKEISTSKNEDLTNSQILALPEFKSFVEANDMEWASFLEVNKGYQENTIEEFKDQNPNKNEKVHFLNITPSMRQSLEREGFPLYGTGGSEPLKNPEVGIRNRIITSDIFNEAKTNLIEKLSTEKTIQSQSGNGTVLNTGLNPEAFIDMVGLMYRGVSDLGEFTAKLIQRFGEEIKPFISDLWYHIQDLSSKASKRFDIAIENWQSNLRKTSQTAAWRMREGERGSFSLRKKSPELEEYFNELSKHQRGIETDPRIALSSIGLAQLSTEFNQVYNILRDITRATNSAFSNVVNSLTDSKTVVGKKFNQKVADLIYQSNEEGAKRGFGFTDIELAIKGLDSNEIQSFRSIREAANTTLDIRQNHFLYFLQEKAKKLNSNFQDLIANGKVAGDPEYDKVAHQLLDLNDQQNKLIDHYKDLKKSDYISLQRTGEIAAFIHDPSFPIGDKQGDIYQQFTSAKDAAKWLQAQKVQLGINPDLNVGDIYDLRIDLEKLNSQHKLNPGQFENLVANSGADPSDPEIDKLRTQIYSNFPSYGYQLEREFIRGYDRTHENIILSITKQASRYSSSSYSAIGGNEAKKALAELDLKKSDPNLYKLSHQYIEDEIAANTKYEFYDPRKWAQMGRKLTFLKLLGGNVNQLWMRAIGHPMTQQLGYFARVNYNGETLTGIEPETYFGRATKLAGEELSGISKNKEFSDLIKQLTLEKVVTPRFTRSVLLMDAEQPGRKVSLNKVEHWASVFMRGGEVAARYNAAAEGFLVGKEKFNLSGTELSDFVVRAVDATNTNPSAGENPYVVRQAGEFGKMMFQFLAFEHLWWQNLALGTKLAKGTGGKVGFLTRELYPLAVMGGISGLPLTAFAATIYSALTGKDPKKQIKHLLGQDNLLERTALYGVTGNETISRKSSAASQTGSTLLNSILSSTSPREFVSNLPEEAIPSFATVEQILQGTKDLLNRGKRLKGLEEVAPTGLANPIKAYEGVRYGLRTRGNETVVPKSQFNTFTTLKQVAGIAPNKQSEFYDKNRTETIIENTRKFRLPKKIRQVF